MTKRATKSPEQRKAETEALHVAFAAKVEELRSSQEWAAMLEGAARLHRFSFRNLALILGACPEARDVRTFAAWKREGRMMRKGESAIRIFRPVTIDDPSGEVDEEGKPAKRVIFRPLPVFDVSQTAPRDGEDDGTEWTQYRPLEGAEGGQVVETVTAWLTGQGWTVETAEPRELGGAEGHADPATMTVRLSSALSPAGAALTILHEAAHVALGHTDQMQEYAAHRGRFEVAAESVAYVVAAALGIDASMSSVPYVATWEEGKDGADAIEATASEVITTAHRLIEGIEESQEEEGQRAA